MFYTYMTVENASSRQLSCYCLRSLWLWRQNIYWRLVWQMVVDGNQSLCSQGNYLQSPLSWIAAWSNASRPSRVSSVCFGGHLSSQDHSKVRPKVSSASLSGFFLDVVQDLDQNLERIPSVLFFLTPEVSLCRQDASAPGSHLSAASQNKHHFLVIWGR